MTAVTRTHSRLAFVGLLLAATCACAGEDRPQGTREAPAVAPPAESLQMTLQHADSSFQDGDYEEARKAYEQVLQISPGHPKATANLATCYLKDRAVKRAQDLLLAFLAGHPDDPAALMVLARARMRQGELGPAAEALSQVLKTHPDFVMAHYNLGFIGYRSR